MERDGKGGFVDKQGRLVITGTFEGGRRFNGGVSHVRTPNSRDNFIINTQGRKVLERVPFMWKFADGLGATPDPKNTSRWGFINQKGEWVIKPRFKLTESFAYGLAAAWEPKGKLGFINKQGEWVVPPNFLHVNNFSANGLAGAALSEGKWGYINRKGEWVIQPEFSSIARFSEKGLARVKKGGKELVIDTSGKEVLGFEAAGEVPLPSGLRWEQRKNHPVLVDTGGETVFPLDVVCETNVARTALDEVIWPRKDLTRICDEKAAQYRFQNEKNRAEAERDARNRAAAERQEAETRRAVAEQQREQNIRSCGHVYEGLSFLMGSGFIKGEYTVVRVMPERGEAVVKRGLAGDSSTWTCSSIPRR